MKKWIRALRPLTLLVAIVLAAVRAGNSQASPERISGPAAAVPLSYFGMHIHRPHTTPWPEVPFKGWRLWDTQTTWAHLEPKKGEWHFETLDQMVNLAAAHNVDVLLCFGRTPAWASSDPEAQPGTRKGETAPPKDIEDWRNFVRTVVTRYRGRIHAYEMWNEPNLAQFYTGDIHTLVELTREGAQIIRSIDPSALVVSPSATTVKGVPWLNAFLQDGGGQFVDVIGYHFYVFPDKPEKIVALARSVRSAMADHNVKLPLWNTETGWAKPKVFETDYEASAYIGRSLLLGWAIGMERFYWYAWDNTDWVTLRLSIGNDFHANANGLTYKTIESWMLGNRVESCSTDANGTWVCHLTGPTSESFIFWNPDGKVAFQPPAVPKADGSWLVTDLGGKSVETKQSGFLANLQPRLLTFNTR
jgi:hypothetical protein